MQVKKLGIGSELLRGHCSYSG